MSKAGQSIIRGAIEALEFSQGTDNSSVIHIPDEINVAKIRAKMKMSQVRFAKQFGLNIRTLQSWEQGKRSPDGAAKVLLTVLSKEPEAVIRAITE